MNKLTPINGNETKPDIFPWGIFKSDTISSLIKKILKYFNDFQSQNFSVLQWKRTQTMEMKHYQTFFHKTYSNLTPNLSLSKIIKKFQWLSKLKFLSFLTKVNPNNENETEACNFSWDIFKSNALFLSKHMKVFQWHSKSNFFSFMTKVKTSKMQMKQNQTFCHRTYSNLTP